MPSAPPKSTSGSFILIQKDVWAFVPHPLPPDLDLTWPLVDQLARANQALGELAGQTRNLPNPNLLIRPFMQKEAVLSSQIEGTQATLSDVLLYEATDGDVPGRSQERHFDVQEVHNYVSAMEYGLERLHELPMSLRFLQELHERLMRGVRGDGKSPGQFRRVQNWIGGGTDIRNATHIPPPVPQMKEALSDWEKFIHQPCELPPLVRLAMLHYQFEAIHPFIDGNGRVGRLVNSLLLCSWGLLPRPLLYLSAYFARHRQEYYERLLAVSREGAWHEWIIFFLKGVEEQSHETIQTTEQLLSLWQTYRDRLSGKGTSSLLLKVVDGLFRVPMYTASLLMEDLQVTHRTAMSNLKRLVDEGILKEVTGRQRGQVFLAEEIYQTVQGNQPKQVS